MTEMFRGVIIARSHGEAQICLDRMHGLLGIQHFDRTWHKDWLVISPRSLNAGRGCNVPNRVLVYDLAEEEISEEVWHAIIPCVIRAEGEALNVDYFRRATQRTDLIKDHVFTVRARTASVRITPDLPCAYRDDAGNVCGKRQDQHRGVPLAKGARDMIAEREAFWEQRQ